MGRVHGFVGRGHGLTCEEALAALDRGDPIHVSGEDMRRFIAIVAPTVPREDRAAIIERAASRVRANAKAL